DQGLAMESRQGRAGVEAGEALERRPRRHIAGLYRPVRERCRLAGDLVVTVDLDQLPARPRHLAGLELRRAIPEHQMRKIDVELVRRHVGTLRHEADIAERAGVRDLRVILAIDGIEAFRRRRIDEIEQPREAVAEIEAAPAAVADLEHAVHLRLDLPEVGEVGILPIERMADRRLEAAFAHGRLVLRNAKGAAGGRRPRIFCWTPRLAERVEGLLEAPGVGLLGLREGLEPVGDLVEALLPRGPRHARVHISVLMRLASDRGLEVVAGDADRLAGGGIA